MGVTNQALPTGYQLLNYRIDRQIRNRVTRNVTIDDLLIPRASKLDDDVVDLLQEPRIADEQHDEIVDLLVAMVFCDRDDRVAIEDAHDGADRRLRTRIRQDHADEKEAAQGHMGSAPLTTAGRQRAGR